MNTPAPARARRGTLRVGVIADYLEEGWPSMNLAAELLCDSLRLVDEGGIEPVLIRPVFRRRFSRLTMGSSRVMSNADRALNRFHDYPRHLASNLEGCDIFHVVDHSYAHLVRALPSSRTVVTCHDVDAFRCLGGRPEHQRSAPFRWMARRTLAGLRDAARVVCDSAATHAALVDHGLLTPDALDVVPLPVHPDFRAGPDSTADARAASLLGQEPGPFLLHVGSTMARKRIDVLLRVFAAVRAARPGARLLRAGGAFSPSQRALAERLGVAHAVTVLPHLDRLTLAAVYRRADLVLLPSSAEGFGFPVVEALACGTMVVATDLPVLREAGGAAAVFCPAGDVDAWRDAVITVLDEAESRNDRRRNRIEAGRQLANTFAPLRYGRAIAQIYELILQGAPRRVRLYG